MDNKELQSLYAVRELAVKKAGIESRIDGLQGQLQEKQALKEMKEEDGKTAIGGSRYIIIFAVLYIILAVICNKVISVILRMGDGLDFGAAVEAALMRSVNPAAGMVFALPLALIASLIVKAALGAGDRKRNHQNRADNVAGRNENQRILQQNAVIEGRNREIMAQVTACRQELDQLYAQLHSTAPWYPADYFTVSAADFLIRQLETGAAANIQQAIVHYEAAGRP